MITQAILMQTKVFFEKLRENSYSLPETLSQAYREGTTNPEGFAYNCYAEAMILKHELRRLGFEKIEEIIIEFNWAEMGLPDWIIALWPTEYPATHIYLRVFDGKDWRVLDPSWDSALAKALGYHLGEWDEFQRPGLTAIGKPYTEEQRMKMFTELDVAEYFRQVEPFMKAANQWIAEQRNESLQKSQLSA